MNRILLTIIIIAAVTAFLVIGTYAANALDWRRSFSGVSNFGEGCGVATGVGSDFVEIFQRKHTVTPMSMPLRGVKNPPRAEPGHFLLVRCELPKSELAPSQSAWMSLGVLYGKSAVFIDQLLVQRTSEHSTYVELPVDLTETKQLTIISLGRKGGVVGPVTLLPFFTTENYNSIQKVRAFIASGLQDFRNVWLGFAIGVLIFLVLLYYYNFRYQDILWLTLYVSFTIIQIAVHTNGESILGEDRAKVCEGIVVFAVDLALIQFMLAFVRSGMALTQLGRPLTYLFLTCMALLPFVGPEIFFSWRLQQQFQAYLTSFCCLALTLYLLRPAKKLYAAERRRIVHGRILAGFTGVVLFAQALLEDQHGLHLAPYVQFLQLGTFLVVAMSDLVRRQSEYFSERKQRIEHEATAQKAVTIAQTAQMLAHDIRRPLFGITHLADYMDEHSESSEAATYIKRMLPSVKKSAVRAEAMLSSIMNLEGTDKPTFTPTSLSALIADICESVALKFRELEIRVENQLQHKLLLAADAPHLCRALQNIIDNAVEAMQAKGTLSLVSRDIMHNGIRAVLLSIGNDGPAIPDDKLERIFDYRFTSNKLGGNGLGLAITRQIIIAHGGTISCEAGLKHGVVFHCILPSAGANDDSNVNLPAVLSQMTKVIPKQSESDACEFLVVDDDDLVLSAWTRKYGVRINVFSNPHAFLAAVETYANSYNTLQGIIVDYQFEGSMITGVDLAIACRKQLPNVPVILASFQTPNKDVAKHFDLVLSGKIEDLQTLQMSLRLGA